jgi:hypothetical protein
MAEALGHATGSRGRRGDGAPPGQEPLFYA